MREPRFGCLVVVAMLRLVLLAAVGGAVVQASGILDEGPVRFSLMLLPLSAAVAWVLIGSR